MGRARYAVLLAGLAAALVAGPVTAEAAPVTTPAPGQVDLAEVAPLQVASTYKPLPPLRVLDTRDGTGRGGVTSPVGQGQSINLDLSAQVPAEATAVVLNVTGTSPTSLTFITVYPAGTVRPEVSNQNLSAGQTRANSVTVELGTSPRGVSLYNAVGSVHLIADIAGYYTSAATESMFTAQAPRRVLDTRGGPGPVGAVGPGQVVAIDFPELPDTATAVTFNLTGVNATALTFVTAFPNGSGLPLASNINLLPNEVVPNQVTVPLGTNKRVLLFNRAGSVHLVADLAGFYATDRGHRFYPIPPERVWDSRPGNGLDPSIIFELTFVGVPEGTSALVANLTGTTSTADQYVVAWPSAFDPPPNSSHLNLVPGQTAANLITVALGATALPDEKTIVFANSAGYVDIIVDAAGIFAP